MKFLYWLPHYHTQILSFPLLWQIIFPLFLNSKTWTQVILKQLNLRISGHLLLPWKRIQGRTGRRSQICTVPEEAFRARGAQRDLVQPRNRQRLKMFLGLSYWSQYRTYCSWSFIGCNWTALLSHSSCADKTQNCYIHYNPSSSGNSKEL